MRKREPISTSSLRGFVSPLGIRLVEGENYRQREAYEIRYLKDDDIPRYQFTIAISLRRAGALLRRLLRLLDSPVATIIEIPAPEDAEPPDEPAEDDEGGNEDWRTDERRERDDEMQDLCDVWMSQELDVRSVLRAFSDHEHLLLHDGLIGFGALSAKAHTELFLDDHKLIHLYTPDLESPEHILHDFGLAATDRLRHFSDLVHTHYSLSALALGEDYVEVFDELRERLRLSWQDTREYT